MSIYEQTQAGARRDLVARYAWSEELEETERVQIRKAAQRVCEIRGMGEVGLAELLFALVKAGCFSDDEKNQRNDCVTDENISTDVENVDTGGKR